MTVVERPKRGSGAALRRARPPRLLVLCPFPVDVAAGQRLKYEQYIPQWTAAGWDVTVSPFMTRALWDIVYRPGRTPTKIAYTLLGTIRRWLSLGRIHRFDVVYVFMYAAPIGFAVLERAIAARSRRLIYDIEDNILSTAEQVAGTNPLKRLLRGSRKARVLLRAADMVITASPFMVEGYRAINDGGNCTLIPPSVDTDRFVPGTRDPAGVPVIGWTGTFSSRPYLDLLRPVLQRLAEKVRFRLRVIGNFDYNLPGVDLEVVQWTKEREVADMQAIDIGLYPLPDDEWVLGKAGLKVIQYMAFGIPSVSSNVGTAPLQVRHGETGYLADSDEDWLTTLELLLRDPKLRARVGAAARAEAVAHYSRQAVGGRYLALLETMRP